MSSAPRYPALAAFEAARTDAERERWRARACIEADARDWDRLARAMDGISGHSADVCRRTADEILGAAARAAARAPRATPPASKTAARRASTEAHLERTLARTLTA
jgi:hypothetical protein